MNKLLTLTILFLILGSFVVSAQTTGKFTITGRTIENVSEQEELETIELDSENEENFIVRFFKSILRLFKE